MSDSFIPYQDPGTTSRKLDSESVVVGANTVGRQRVQISGRKADDILPVDADKGIAVSGAQPAATAQAITTAGAQTAVEVANYAQVLITFRGTYSNFNFYLEASPDGVNYFPIDFSIFDAVVPTFHRLSWYEGGILSEGYWANDNVSFYIVAAVAGFTHVRLNVGELDSGTVEATITPTNSRISEPVLVEAVDKPLPVDPFLADGWPKFATTNKTTVPTAGTSVLLLQNSNFRYLTIKALKSNTGLIYVRNPSLTSSNGFQLSAGESISLWSSTRVAKQSTSAHRSMERA